MRKLILLVAIATTMSFAACTGTSTTKPEEAAIENATEALQDATQEMEAATEMLEDVVDSLATTVD